MPKTRQEKEDVVQRVSTLFRDAKSIVFTHFKGLSVAEVNDLRSRAREQGVVYVVVKKTLLKKASDQAGYDIDPRTFEGEVASVFGLYDEVAPAKMLALFAKSHEALQWVGGLLSGRFITADAVEHLSTLPSREELLAKVMYTVKAPITGLARVLQGNLRGLFRALSQIQEKKSA